MIDRLLQSLNSLIRQVLIGDRGWGWFRLFCLSFVLLMWAWLCSLIFGNPIVLFSSPDSPRSLAGFRYLILPLAGILGTLSLAAHYIQDIFNLKNFKVAFRYVWSTFFGMFYPSIEVKNGKKKIGSGEDNLLSVIGGPGFISVEPSSVVLLEHLGIPSNVLTNGTYFVKRFETIKSITDLRVQQVPKLDLQATTRDGIPMKVDDIRFQYRLLEGRTAARSEPYSFSTQAVRNLTYNRVVAKNGLIPWENAVRKAVESAIVDYINMNFVDTITAPRKLGKDPRLAIRDQVHSINTRTRLRAIGTKLRWVDIGQINPENPEVDLERLRAWQARWNSHASVVRAQGEAQRFAYQELGRAETQAELLRGIVSSLKDMNLSDKEKRKDNVRKIVLARTAQLLESMTSVYQTMEGKSFVGSFSKNQSADIVHSLVTNGDKGRENNK